MAIPQAFPRPARPRRLIGPSGVLLFLLCLFFPFVGVSCSGSMGTVDVGVSGWDMAVSGAPSVSGTGAFSDGSLPTSEFSPSSGDPMTEGVGLHPLMMLGVGSALVAAVLGAALPTPFARSLGGLLAAAAATALIAANEAVVLSELQGELDSGAMMGGTIESGTRFGFWVALIPLVAVLGYHVLEAAFGTRNPAPPGPTYPPQHLPGQPYPQGPAYPPQEPQYPPGEPHPPYSPYPPPPPAPPPQYPPAGTAPSGPYSGPPPDGSQGWGPPPPHPGYPPHHPGPYPGHPGGQGLDPGRAEDPGTPGVRGRG
ncbi:hypothetical protein CLV63_114118 [Murinocardiopsis flavida]|uniref:Uncharacterized protein n=1 Tax=Murinocardiopsis flavida TaxID=645275 RepID=A0A2P8DEP0_9ACTN|nr:hypothetical protein [Murinocardiopsis flavida]PSK95685.1 hypothetical protein CLV63_114118 [Murinocardiopsis flavida]